METTGLEVYTTDFWNNGSYELLPGNYVVSTPNSSADTDLDKFVRDYMGEKRKDIVSVVFLTIVYSIIFVTGVIGNLSTCIVIGRNAYMHTVTNYYLLNLAVSDVLTLVLALPPEVYAIWEAYPWRLGEAFCIFKSFLMEMTSYSSVLTITGFTVERYIAICHPIKLQKVCRVSRAVKCIILIWIISSLSALGYPVHTRMFHFLRDPKTDTPLQESLVCNIPPQYINRILTLFMFSFVVYFLVPMVVISVFYVLIGLRLRRTEKVATDGITPQYGKATATRARKAVLKMLVAVVVAFFVCWAPYHAQRLMTLYVKNWTSELLRLQSNLFYISGVLFFFSSTVNPILYNVLSRKFRQAFKRTLCRCCLNFNTLPTFYKLRAKFININEPGQTSYSNPSRYLNADKNSVRMKTFYGADKKTSCCLANGLLDHQSTRDTEIKGTSQTSTTHAHSDGRLHYLCRHKRCISKRQSLLAPRNNGNIASFQDIETLRQQDPCLKRKKEKYEFLSTSDSSVRHHKGLLIQM